VRLGHGLVRICSMLMLSSFLGCVVLFFLVRVCIVFLMLVCVYLPIFGSWRGGLEMGVLWGVCVCKF